MRAAFIVTAVALAGLAASGAAGPRPREMAWKILAAPQAEAPQPRVERGELILQGRAVRSVRTFRLPVSVALEILPEPGATNAAFYLQFAPAEAVRRNQAGDFLAVKIVESTDEPASVLVWVSRGSRPEHLMSPGSVRKRGRGGRYRVELQCSADALLLRVNEQSYRIETAFPYEEFHILLRTFPPPSQWRVRNFVVR